MMGAIVERRRLRIDRAAGDLLRTWGQIAAVLNVCERTARRWARYDGLPVFKRGGRTATVVASRRAVLAWQADRCRPAAGHRAG